MRRETPHTDPQLSQVTSRKRRFDIDLHLVQSIEMVQLVDASPVAHFADKNE